MAEYYTRLLIKLTDEVFWLKIKTKQMQLQLDEKEAVRDSVKEMCIKNGQSELRIKEIIADGEPKDHHIGH